VLALVQSPWLAGLAAGATSALGAERLARPGAVTVGLVGCGVHGAAQLACLRSALEVERVVAYARDRDRLERFCDEHGAEAAEHSREAAEVDVVVTTTTSRDPVLRGDWLRPGTTVCAAGTVSPEARELDNVVLERAAFVCCDSVPAARAAAGDLIEPVERGVLDWLEVHALGDVLRGELEGRQATSDIVLLKIVGRAALRLMLASLAAERSRA
jgi:ornithine cyclodeaminase/alanine dehydrogenase-like protein (mu-crystallin family)